MRYYRGDLTGALEDLERAWHLELELGREAQLSYALNAIANLYADARVAQYDRALEHYGTLLARHQANGDLRQVATAHFNLASTLEGKGELGAALDEYQRALEIDRRREDPDDIAADQRALGALLVKLGRAREALAPLDAALRSLGAPTKRLYAAKEAGRNRVAEAPEPPRASPSTNSREAV
jgi:tetratricopeptide (TPR) repeat protein